MKQLQKYAYLVRPIGIGVVMLFALLVFATALPVLKGYKALVVSSSSMEPAIPVASVVFIKKERLISIGDVITYKLISRQDTLVTHRVVAVTKQNGTEAYRVKGDAVKAPDGELVAKKDIVGKAFLHIPLIGKPIAFAKTELGLIFLIIIPASLVVYEELKSIVSQIRKMKKERKTAHA